MPLPQIGLNTGLTAMSIFPVPAEEDTEAGASARSPPLDSAPELRYIWVTRPWSQEPMIRTSEALMVEGTTDPSQTEEMEVDEESLYLPIVSEIGGLADASAGQVANGAVSDDLEKGLANEEGWREQEEEARKESNEAVGGLEVAEDMPAPAAEDAGIAQKADNDTIPGKSESGQEGRHLGEASGGSEKAKDDSPAAPLSAPADTTPAPPLSKVSDIGIVDYSAKADLDLGQAPSTVPSTSSDPSPAAAISTRALTPNDAASPEVDNTKPAEQPVPQLAAGRDVASEVQFTDETPTVPRRPPAAAEGKTPSLTRKLGPTSSADAIIADTSALIGDTSPTESLPNPRPPSTSDQPMSPPSPHGNGTSNRAPTPTIEEDEEESPRQPSPSPAPPPPAPRPTFSSSASPAPTLPRLTLKRKDTMEDLFSAQGAVKRKKVELVPKAKAADVSEDTPATAADHSDLTHIDGNTEIDIDIDHPVDNAAGDAGLESEEELEPMYNAQKGQWRVGRLPGHQGSHIRRHEAGGEAGDGKRGTKRSLGQNITDSAEKVLKKPFRLPARVVLKSTPKRPRSTSPPPSIPSPSVETPTATSASSPIKPAPARVSSRPFAVPRKIARPVPVYSELFPSSPKSSTSTLPSSPPSLSTSTSTSSPLKPSPTFSKRLSKPFKTPFSRSAAPSPISTIGSARSRAKSTREALAELEKEERTLRNAIKYHTQPEEDERLVELIHIWREAGRTVAELLFDIQPKPDASAGGDGAGLDGVGGGRSSFFGDNGRDSFFPTQEFTPEQLRQIGRMRTNADGDPIDDEGNPVFGGGNHGDALEFKDGMGDEKQGGEEEAQNGMTKAPESDEWTIGTMLAKMGVEPSMYAWDADAEDWGVPEED